MFELTFLILRVQSPGGSGPPVGFYGLALLCCLVTQPCSIIYNPKDCSLPDSSVHGLLQARILEWVAISSSRESSWPGHWTCISRGSCIAGGFFTTEPPGKLLCSSFHFFLTAASMEFLPFKVPFLWVWRNFTLLRMSMNLQIPVDISGIQTPWDEFGEGGR